MDEVAAVAAIQAVVAGVADQLVIAGASAQQIGAGAPVHAVGARAAREPVRALESVQDATRGRGHVEAVGAGDAEPCLPRGAAGAGSAGASGRP